MSDPPATDGTPQHGSGGANPTQAELYIREVGRTAAGEGAGARIWPASAPSPGLIQETRTYILELHGPPDCDRADLLIDGEPIEALRSDSSSVGRWRWSTGFYAGSVGFEVRLADGRRLRGECITDPDLRKLTRDEFDSMVRDIVGDSLALFAVSSFRTGFARGIGHDVPPISRLEFLASRVAELERVIAAVDRQPVRVLRSREQWVPTDRAKEVTGRELLRSIRGRRLIPVDPKSSPAAHALGGYLPDAILKAVRREDLDIREHRDMKAALTAWAAWLLAKSSLLAAVKPRDAEDVETVRLRRRWASRCRALAERLEALLKLPLFAHVSPQSAPLVVTSVYRRNPAYRRFHALYRDMQLGIARVTGDHLQLPLGRTYALYELWVFLRLLRAAAERFGISDVDPGGLLEGPADRSGLVLSGRSASIEIVPGLVMHFQRQFEEFWWAEDQTGSFSRTMRPDVSVSRFSGQHGELTGPKLVVLDAKYRIDDGLNESLSSIHMYRDALVGLGPGGDLRGLVVAAYLVSPQLPKLAAGWADEPMPGRLFHPEYLRAFRFGAVTLRPGSPLEDAVAVVEAVARDAGVKLPPLP